MKKVIVIAVMFAVLAGAVYAQSIPGGFVSPQNSATQGRIRSAADDFIRPDAYTGVTFENWYGMVSFANTGIATLGYAAKAGGLYIGAFYSGSFWANITTPAYTEQTVSFAGADKQVPVYGAVDLAADGNPSNQIAVLIGVADMGFRLSFRTTYEFFKTDGDSLIAAVPYKSYETENGLISPQIAWSMTKNLIDIGIKPWVTFDLGFNRAYSKTAEYSNTAGGWTASEMIGSSQNYIAPEFNIGLGGITLANKNGWRTSVDMEYRLQIRAYDNDYNYTDSDGVNQIKTFNGTYNAGVLNERSYNGHRIRPSISTQWNGEKLRLRARLDLNLIFSGEENNPMALKSDNSGALINSGRSAKISVFEFNPDLALAAQWQVTSSFFLNIGGRITLAALRNTTTEGNEYNATGAEIANSSYKTVNSVFGGTSNQFTLGVTLNATDNLGFEANTGVSNTASNSLNVFDTTDGVFVFGSVLVSLKF